MPVLDKSKGDTCGDNNEVFVDIELEWGDKRSTILEISTDESGIEMAVVESDEDEGINLFSTSLVIGRNMSWK